MRTHGDKFGRGRNADFGRVNQPISVPARQHHSYGDFSKGYFSANDHGEVPDGGTDNALDVEITRKDRLVPVPGIALVETYLAQSPGQMVLHAGLEGVAELVLFAPPFIGVYTEDGTAWEDIGLAASTRPVAHTNFGSTLIFSNGYGAVRARQFGGSVSTLPDAPVARTYASFAGRVFAGYAEIDGNHEPLGMRWSDADSDYRHWTGLGSGAELLIDDMSQGDHIVAARSMGLDLMAVVLRKSIWLGRRTGLRDRPADFTPRVAGLGAVSERTVKVTRFGLVMLTDEGVALFDGNQLRIVSEAINAELLPLDLNQLAYYHATYNPRTGQYLLFTPAGTWVYDMPKQRWFPKRSLIARASSMYAPFIPGPTWDELVGTWDEQTQTWEDMRPEETGELYLMVLADAEVEGISLGREEPLVTTNFGVPTAPFWEFPYRRGEFLNQLMLIQSVGMTYIGGGTVGIRVPNIEGDMRTVSDPEGYTLPATALPRIRTMHGNVSGLGLGVRLDFLTGRPEIGQVQLGFQPRGPRIEGSSFTPREFYEDFLG